jgi:hypothetical protein
MAERKVVSYSQHEACGARQCYRLNKADISCQRAVPETRIVKYEPESLFQWD